MGNKGSNSTTSTTAPNAEAMQAYQDLLQRAGGVASTPYQAYGGEMTAPINAQQQMGVGNINQNAGFAQPYIQQAAGYANDAAAPISGQDISQYLNPYTQNVVDATQAQFSNQNAQQQSQVLGNAASQNALGGDRVGVAQGVLAGQQQRAQAPVIAGLYSQGYGQAVQTALAEQQAKAQGAYSLGNLGVSGQNAALQGAGAQVGAGSLYQSTQQAQDTAQQQEFMRQQAYPFQTTQWLAGLQTGVGSQMGGTSTTTPPKPNPWSQALGVGLTAASMFLKHGGRVPGYDSGGGVEGIPYAGVAGYVPTMSIKAGKGAPEAPKAGVANDGLSDITKGLQGLSGAFAGGSGPLNINPMGSFSPTGYGEIMPFAPASILPAIYRHGGAVRGFADGGMAGFGTGSIVPSFADGGLAFDDRWGDFPGDVTGGTGNRLDLDSVNAGDPIQDVNPGSYGAWRGAVDRDTGVGQSAQPVRDAPPAGVGVAALPPEITRGLSRPQPEARSDDLGGALAYDTPRPGAPVAGVGAPEAPQGVSRETPKPGMNFGLGYLSPAAKAGLMAAGLGMLASKSPNLGNAIGEGGLAGVQAYTGQQKTERDIAKDERTFGLHEREYGLKERNVNMAAQKLASEAKRHAEELALKTKQAADLTDYRQGLLTRDNLRPTGTTTEDGHPIMYDTRKPGVAIDGITGQPIKPTEKVVSAKQAAPMSDSALEIGARQLAAGDMSPLTNIGRGTQGDARILALRNKAADILVNEGGMKPTEAAAHLSKQVQEFRARGTGLGAEARTAGTREANLNIILKATEAAIPAAIEASKNISRTGFVPLNKIIQKGQVMTSNPELREFGMANLQLAEHWARAMNPTGVMRESDRDKALEFLSTADSQPTYERVVNQLHKQIQREQAAVASTRAPVPGGPAPSEPAPPAGAARVRQNGHTYERQPDGSYKAVD